MLVEGYGSSLRGVLLDYTQAPPINTQDPCSSSRRMDLHDYLLKHPCPKKEAVMDFEDPGVVFNRVSKDHNAILAVDMSTC